MAVFNYDHPDPVMAGKAPLGKDWPNRARQNPPECVTLPPVKHAMNTGVLCDGLRAFDLDIDDKEIASRCRSIIIGRFGEAPIRMRQNSSRCLILYRAAVGEPPKVVIAGTLGKIEVLGKGQQFVAFGRHPSGAELEWFPDAPGQEPVDALAAVTEDDVFELLAECAPIIGAEAPTKLNGHDHASSAEAQADPLRIAAALNAIPNGGPPDWEGWNRVGMALWRATGGSPAGWEAWSAWSQRNAAYNPTETRKRWDHYAVSPPTSIGAGSIFHMAGAAQRAPPPPANDDEYWAGLENQSYEQQWDEPEQADAVLPGKAKPSILWSITEPWNSADIPVRPWLARGYLMRRSLTVISGPGSAGKSSLMNGWASALAVGCAYHRFKPIGELRVATYNVEDDADEQKRRFSAFFDKLGLKPDAFMSRLAILGPTHVGTLLHTGRDGSILINTLVMDKLVAFVDGFKPDVLILDPFVELHAAEENDNTAVRSVMARFRSMAIEHNMAVVILHHARKGIGEPGDPESLRGASSIVGAARVVLTVNVMTEEDAKAFSIPPDRRRNFFRLDGAKNNYAPIEEAEWFERIEIKLDNGADDKLSDTVVVAWPWKPPSVWVGTAPHDTNKALDRIAEGPSPGILYTASRKGASGRWAGKVLYEVLGVNDEQAKRMIDQWIQSGLLEETDYIHPEWRRSAKGVRVNDEKRPTL